MGGGTVIIFPINGMEVQRPLANRVGISPVLSSSISFNVQSTASKFESSEFASSL